jgi:hypothetical protein
MHNYLYKGFLIEVWEQDNLWHSIVNADKKIRTAENVVTQEEAEFAAESLIDSWN